MKGDKVSKAHPATRGRIPKNCVQDGKLPPELTIPDRFSQVVRGIYRSSYPDAMHSGVFEALRVKTILRFVSEDYSLPLKQFFARKHIRCLLIPVEPNKEEAKKSSNKTVDAILKIIMDQGNQPVVIHCNQGKHRTGCMVACFRKLQGWVHDAIMAEYKSFAGIKARPLDDAFVKAYSPSQAICKAAQLKNVAAWTVAPDQLTGVSPHERSLSRRA